MKIVSKAELMTMPRGTPFAEYRGAEVPWPEGFEIFVSACSGVSDFFYRSINSPEHHDCSELMDREQDMEDGGTSYPVDLVVSREGYYDPTMRYLIWEPEDVTRIIALLQGADADQGDL